MLAGGVRAVALVGGAGVAVGGAGRAGGLLGVRGAIRPGAGAELRDVAFPGGAAARRAGRREGIGGAGGGRAVTGLCEVARAGSRPAHGAGVPRRVTAGGARAVAHVEGAGVAVVGAGRARGLARVGGAGVADAGAGLREIAVAGRGPADRRGGQERAARGAAGAAVALLAGIDDPVAAAAGAAVPAADAATVERLAAVRQAVTAARRLRHGDAEIYGLAPLAGRDVRVALNTMIAHAAGRVHEAARDDEVDRRSPGRARELGRPDADDQAVARGRILVEREHSGLHSRRVLKRQADAVVPVVLARAVHPDTGQLNDVCVRALRGAEQRDVVVNGPRRVREREQESHDGGECTGQGGGAGRSHGLSHVPYVLHLAQLGSP